MHPGCRVEQVYLCRDPVDFRKSIGGLSVLAEQELGLDPFGSALYVFVNRDHNKIKVLYWHRNGFCLWLKRLEAEKFAWPCEAEGATQTVTVQQFEWLLEGFDLMWRYCQQKIAGGAGGNIAKVQSRKLLIRPTLRYLGQCVTQSQRVNAISREFTNPICNSLNVNDFLDQAERRRGLMYNDMGLDAQAGMS